MRVLSSAGWLPALLVGLALAAPAEARTCTVGDAAAGCATLADALRAAEDNGEADVVRLPTGTVPGASGATYTSPERLDVVGAGAGASVLAGPLRLDGARVILREATLSVAGGGGLEASGHLRSLRVTGEGPDDAAGVRALPTAPLVLDDVLVDVEGTASALEARCSTLVARHVTILGSTRVAGRAGCAGLGTGRLSLDSSIVGPDHVASLREDPGGEAGAAYSNLAGTAQGADVSNPVDGDPGFRSTTDPRLAPDSRLVERGNPAPLFIDRPAPGEVDSSEPQADLDGDVRAADGDGDGRARRDVGAFELQPGPAPVPAGNLLENPDAEAAGMTAVPGWSITAGFETVAYGTDPFPGTRQSAGLSGGTRFFSGGARGDASATQIVDVGARAERIDAGAARVTLSGLLGGYRGDGDAPSVRATFRGPSGVALGVLELEPVDAADRANATTLLARSVSAAVPGLTRSIEVTLLAAKALGGTYTDAYFDNLGLVVEAAQPPGGGPGGDGGGNGGGRLRPFAGIVVLAGQATLSRPTGRTKLLVGCASATVARCTGDLVLEAMLVRGQARTAVGSARVSLAPGQTRRVSVRLSRPARAYLRRHTRLRALVRTAAVDGQGNRRATTVPITVRPQWRPARRQAASRRARARGSAGTARAPAGPPAAGR